MADNYFGFCYCGCTIMALINYKYTYLAGGFINLDATLDSTNSAGVLSHITGAYNPEVQKVNNVDISNQDLEYSRELIWNQTRFAPNNIEYMAIYGAHIMTKHIPRNATKRQNRLAEMSSFNGILDGDEIGTFMAGAPGPKTYNYKYTYYLNQDVDPCLVIYSHRQRTVSFLEDSCDFIKRRGRIRIYESVYSNTFINPMTNPLKIGIYSNLGEGGSIIIENNNRTAFLASLSTASINVANEQSLFPI